VALFGLCFAPQAGFGDAHLTLQRFKYSYSGTAAAMDKNKKVTGRWVQAGDYNQKSFISQAQDDMMKMISKYADFQIMEGKSTVDALARIGLTARSEERRVGKECLAQCRSRWSPYH
jgi:hypothetical protein